MGVEEHPVVPSSVKCEQTSIQPDCAECALIAKCPLTTSEVAQWAVAMNVSTATVQCESRDVCLAKAKMTHLLPVRQVSFSKIFRIEVKQRDQKTTENHVCGTNSAQSSKSTFNVGFFWIFMFVHGLTKMCWGLVCAIRRLLRCPTRPRTPPIDREMRVRDTAVLLLASVNGCASIAPLRSVDILPFTRTAVLAFSVQ